ncbi:glycerophosphodiester phosphodiesterase family protein [Fusibacter ferrireducens]|uniref:Glycerophosphodiester phosphodiesterase n=1 Tax=Fusibacter ferrireducens TaxID=2785058 RepID=A0ABR9ZZV9_9FIRM|nr:glycerophosphodiester phosphodiesterase family protein [Fusibacter ferrireducens]MBF4695978.1 glycerophosphodiester phosphodiesterase [Fusibacter ferrireducens]
MNTKVLAHRGFKSLYPENTLLAFRKALEIGAHGLELDIHFSKDGELMVFHDFELERMTGTKGYLYDFTCKELKKMPIHQDGHEEKIPLLEEVLILFSEFEKEKPLSEPRILNVEFKAGSLFYPDIEEKALHLCLKYLNKNQLIFSSFDHQALVKIKELNSEVLTGALTASALVDPWLYLNRIQADFYHPHYFTLGGEHLKHMLKHHLKINTYTLNDPQVARQLIQHQIHAIITDCPDKILEILHEEVL